MKSYEIQKLIYELYPNAYQMFKNHNITTHKWIKEEYPEGTISDELGFFEGFSVFDEEKKKQKELDKSLCNACQIGDLDKVKYLISKGANINCTEESHGFTPLILVCKNNNSDKFELIKYLVKNGVNVNTKSDIGDTALIWLVTCRNCLQEMKYLIKHGADMNIKNKQNENVLYWAFYNIFEEEIKYLILQGVDLILKNSDDEYCCRYNQILDDPYEIQKLICERYPNGINILMKNGIKIHKWIEKEYPEEIISDELGFFN